MIEGDRGLFNFEDVLKSINPPDFYHSPKTSLVCIENTTNKGGGACWDIIELKKIKKICDENNLFFHLDGARIWNAFVENKINFKEYGKLFDTISVCLSKGLGCPVGSLLLTSSQYFENALKIRKILGGGMRQSGYLAACGIYALDNNINRLKDDHLKAKEIESVLSKLDYIKKVEPVETNIIIFYVHNHLNSNDFISKMKEKNIFLTTMGEGKIRIVTHLDFTDQMLEKLIDELKKMQ